MIKVPAPKILARMLKKVSTTNPASCWNWTSTKKGAYGEIRIHGRKYRAHRVMLALHLNWMELLDDPSVVVRHMCNNPLCVNPAHLQPGTAADNVRDKFHMDRQFKGLVCPCCNHKF